MAEGKVQAYFSADCDPKLASLLFDRSDIQQCIQSMKLENGWVSREDVTKLLKVKDITLARWVKFGLIAPAAIYGGAQHFDKVSVDKFIAEHVTTEEAVEILGVGKLTLQKWARQGKLLGVCVSGPNIDGHHGYIFNTRRLAHWYDDNLRLRKQ